MSEHVYTGDPKHCHYCAFVAVENDRYKVLSEAMAYREIANRNEEAHKYLQTYGNPVDVWGHNIWHVILDDCIKLRKENDALRKDIDIFKRRAAAAENRIYIFKAAFNNL